MYQSNNATELSVMIKNYQPSDDFFKSRLWEWMRNIYPTEEDRRYLQLAVANLNLDFRILNILSTYHRLLCFKFVQRPTHEQMWEIANTLWSMIQWRYLPLLIHHDKHITEEMMHHVVALERKPEYIPFPCHDHAANNKIARYVQDKLNNRRYYIDTIPLELVEMLCFDMDICNRFAQISLIFEVKHFNNPNSRFWKDLIRQNVRDFSSPAEYQAYITKLNLHGHSYKQLFERISTFKAQRNLSDLVRYGAIKILEYYQNTLLATDVTTLVFYFNYAVKYSYNDILHYLITINEMRPSDNQIPIEQLTLMLNKK